MDQTAVRAILIVVLIANTTAAAEVAATRLDGRSVAGELKSWDEAQAVVETADGQQRIPLKELLSLRWPSTPAASESSTATTSGQVELVDGSVLPVREFGCTASRANITLAAPGAKSAHELSLAKRQIAAVRLQPFDAALVEQWNEIRDIKPSADVIVLLKREGQSLDYVEGLLGDITSDKVNFALDDEAMKVDRKKVAGFIYFRRDTVKETDPRFLVRGRSGLTVNAASARLKDDSIQLTTTGGTKFDWPLEDIYLADFSAEKLVYLSDLEPASVAATPLVAMPNGISLAGKYAEPRRDHSAFGGPLRLTSGNDLSSTLGTDSQTFTKGLAVRSRTELVYRLPPGYRRLAGAAGIDPATRASGNVHLEILGDDEPLLSADITGADPPRAIDVDIARVKRLKIVVDYGKNLDTGDWLNLCDLRIVK